MARERLSSRLGFILLSAGCAIGLGNVWRFPYITGRYGGAAFVLMYLLFLVFMGVPVMIMEFAIGRAGRMNIVGALRNLEPKGSKWHGVGYAAMIVSIVRQLAVLLPVASLLAATGVLDNVWLSFTVAEAVGLTLSICFYAYVYKKKIKPIPA